MRHTDTESSYIIGVDLGDDSSCISFYNHARRESEVIDLSGGYGKPSQPTVMQYIPHSKEWVYGDYAMLNMGYAAEVNVRNIIQRLGSGVTANIDGKAIPVKSLLAMYLKELLNNIKNINPKAHIEGIVCAVPDYMSENAQNELKAAFQEAGYGNQLLEIAPNKACIMTKYAYENATAVSQPMNILLLDYGSRELRGSINKVQSGHSGIEVDSVDACVDESVSIRHVDDCIYNLLIKDFPQKIDANMREQLIGFMYGHKDLMLKELNPKQPVNMYMNFIYPPYRRSITKSEIERGIEGIRNRLFHFLERFTDIDDSTDQRITDVICTGGGFEMFFAKSVVNDIFENSRRIFYKNAKTVASEGAAIKAASLLGIVKQPALPPMRITDRSKTEFDYGLLCGRFITIIERSTFKRQGAKRRMFILQQPTGQGIDYGIQVARRDKNGAVHTLSELRLDGLPTRPKGTTKLCFDFAFEGGDLGVTVKDFGFGEIFPASAFELKQMIKSKE